MFTQSLLDVVSEANLDAIGQRLWNQLDKVEEAVTIVLGCCIRISGYTRYRASACLVARDKPVCVILGQEVLVAPFPR